MQFPTDKEIRKMLKDSIDDVRSNLPDSVNEYLEYAIHEVTDSLVGGCKSVYSITKCGSPVEQLFYIAANQQKESIYQEIDSKYLYSIQPQYKVGKFRVDFMAEIFEIGPCWEPVPLVRVFIEVDGHEFHEKTKQQVAKDKKRDRELSTKCDALLKFSGSEVYKKPYLAARDLEQTLIAKYKEKLSRIEV